MRFRTMLDRRRVTDLGRLAVLVVGGASALGFAGGLWWAFDLFCHFRAQYLAASILLALVFAAARATRWAFAALALAALNLAPILPLFLQPAEAAPHAAEGTLRLLSFNVFRFNRQYDRLLAYVQRQRPDVLVLVEITADWMPSVRQLASAYPYQWTNAGDDVTGIAVMSRLQPRDARTVDLGNHGVPSYLLTFERAGGEIAVLGAHLNWPLGARASRTRNTQLAAIARLARTHPRPLVVLGDLNITPFSAHFHSTLRDGGLQPCVPGGGLRPTWPAHFPPLLIQIDHCLASARVRAWSFRVGEYLGSDHYPISVEVAPMVEGER